MLARLILTLLIALPLMADSFRLYMKDGTWQQVREYKVEEDRVRYYSTERSDWEELPLRMTDLEKTEHERKRVVEETRKIAAAEDAEEKFDAEQAKLVAAIPKEPGVYFFQDAKVSTLKQAESKIVRNKKREVLKYLSPVPLIPGKSTIELDGVQSGFVITEEKPVLWFRLRSYERFGIVRCAVKKESRVVETWNIVPVSKEVVSERDPVELFTQQVGEDLYRIWPQKGLAAGEYAVIEYTEGERNTQVWDFRVERR